MHMIRGLKTTWFSPTWSPLHKRKRVVTATDSKNLAASAKSAPAEDSLMYVKTLSYRVLLDCQRDRGDTGCRYQPESIHGQPISSQSLSEQHFGISLAAIVRKWRSRQLLGMEMHIELENASHLILLCHISLINLCFYTFCLWITAAASLKRNVLNHSSQTCAQ